MKLLMLDECSDAFSAINSGVSSAPNAGDKPGRSE